MSNNTMKQNTLEMKGGKTVYLQYKEWWNAKINAIELEKVTQITNKINDLTKDEPDNKIQEKLKKELKDRKEEWKTDVKANTEFNKIFAFGINFGITSLGKTKKQKPPSSHGATLLNWEKEGKYKYPGKDYIEPRANTALVNYVIGQIQKSYNNFKRNQTAQEKDYSTNETLGDAVKKTASVYMLSKFEGKHGQNFSTNSKDRGNVFDQIKNDYLNRKENIKLKYTMKTAIEKNFNEWVNFKTLMNNKFKSSKYSKDPYTTNTIKTLFNEHENKYFKGKNPYTPTQLDNTVDKFYEETMKTVIGNIISDKVQEDQKNKGIIAKKKEDNLPKLLNHDWYSENKSKLLPGQVFVYPVNTYKSNEIMKYLQGYEDIEPVPKNIKEVIREVIDKFTSNLYDFENTQKISNNYNLKDTGKLNRNAQHMLDIADDNSYMLRYIDNMHQNDIIMQKALNNDENVNIKDYINDREHLRSILVAIFENNNYAYTVTNGKGVKGDPIVIKIPSYVFVTIKTLYDKYEANKKDSLSLTSWIFKSTSEANTHLLRHKVKVMNDTNKLQLQLIYNIPAQRKSDTVDWKSVNENLYYDDVKSFLNDNENINAHSVYIILQSKSTLLEDETHEGLGPEKLSQRIQEIQNSNKNKGKLPTKTAGGKKNTTRKRKPKATKKKNRPVKQKFTRKHRGGLAFRSKVEQIRLMDELMNSDDYMNDAAKGIREALKDSKTGPLVYGLKNQASSSPFNFHEFMADIFIPGTRDYNENLNKIKNAYIVDKDNHIYLVKTSNVGRKLGLGKNRLKITFTSKLVPKLWLKSAMTDDRINKDQLRDELQREAGAFLGDKSESDAKIRDMITRKDNTYTFNEDKYQKNYGKKLLNIIKNLKLPNPESYMEEFENHNHDDLDSESITYDKSIDVEILFKKVTENMGTKYTDLSSLPDYKKYLEAKAKQEKKSKPLAKEPKIEEVPEYLPPPPPTDDGAKKMAESSTGTDTPVMVDSSTGDDATVMTESSTGTDAKEMKDSNSQTDAPTTAKVVSTGVLKEKSDDVVA